MLILFEQCRIAGGLTELGGKAAFHRIDGIGRSIVLIDGAGMDIRQVVVLIEHLDEALPVALGIEFSHSCGFSI